MIDADYLRRQAESCLTLSRTTFDLVVAGRLRALADELRRKAQEVEDGDGDFVTPMLNSAVANGCRNGSNRAE